MKNLLRAAFAVIALSLCAFDADAQTVLGNPPPSLPYIKDHIDDRKPIQYTHLREADVMWSKTIWRVVDLREKQNLPLYYPITPINDRLSLFDVIKKGLQSGELTAYDKPLLDDEFNYEMPLSQVNAKLNFVDTVLTQDLNTGAWDTVLVPRQIMSENVKQYWVKEVWFFDKQRSVMDVRIIGISPLIEKIDKTTGEFRGYEPLFWLYFPGCRNYFAKYECFNRQSDAERRTYDDIFHKRLFESYIRKESNVYDRLIIEYAQQMAALLESDRVKEDLFIIEHDLWHF
ncbi:MAG: gliding motility protein GldN [Bacteroidota bacterium]